MPGNTLRITPQGIVCSGQKAPIPADPATLYPAGIAEIEAALAHDTSAELRAQALPFISWPRPVRST